MKDNSTEILYRKIQKQKMKMMFAELLVQIIDAGEVQPEAINNIFEQVYNKHF